MLTIKYCNIIIKLLLFGNFGYQKSENVTARIIFPYIYTTIEQHTTVYHWSLKLNKHGHYDYDEIYSTAPTVR